MYIFILNLLSYLQVNYKIWFSSLRSYIYAVEDDIDFIGQWIVLFIDLSLLKFDKTILTLKLSLTKLFLPSKIYVKVIKTKTAVLLTFLNKLFYNIMNKLINFVKSLLANKLLNNILNNLNLLKIDFDSKNFKYKLNYKNWISIEEPLKMDKNFILKQNKVPTYFEFISYIVSSKNNRSKYYTPLQSFFPLFISSTLLMFFLMLISLFFKDKSIFFKSWLFIFALFCVSMCLAFWFSVFYLEKKKGYHNVSVKRNIQFGFYIFIFTEALCFISLFWTFLHSTLASSIHVGVYNPGEGITNFYINEDVDIKRYWDIYAYHTYGTPGRYNMSDVYTLFDRELFAYRSVKVHINLYDQGSLINPYGLPFINTLILLASAASLNASHCLLILSKYIKSLFWLFITIIFGLLFVSMQYKEYKSCSFNYNDGIFAACFLGTTGLHGIHVMIGIFALCVCLINIFLKNYSPRSHQTFYFSIFYWHFVDVIWILVWFIIYFWPGAYFFRVYPLIIKADVAYYVLHMNTKYFLNLLDFNFHLYCFKNDFYLYLSDQININNFFSKNFISFNNNEVMEFLQLDDEINVFDLKDSYIIIELFYQLFLMDKHLFNFNIIKKDIEYFTTTLTEMHYDIYRRLDFAMFDDMYNKPKRFFLFIFLYLVDKNLSKIFAKIFLAIYSNFNIWNSNFKECDF